jgi:hypothetical protein
MKALFIIMYWGSTQVKTSDTTYLWVEVIGPRCIDFISPKDYGNIMAR